MKVIAKVFDYGIELTKNGDPKIVILFRYGDTFEKDVQWNGFLTEKTKKSTLDALLVCGLKTDEIHLLAKGNESGLLDMEKEVQLTLEEEEYNGKKYLRARWVNEVGGGGFAKRITEGDALAKIQTLNLKFDLMEARKSKGVQTEKVPF